MVREKIELLIKSGVTDFISGGMGGFDIMCAREVYELKREYPYICSHIVIPYLSFNIFEKKYFDSVIYPDGFEKYHFKAAIPARNKYLVDNSAYAVCFVKYNWGGAAKTLERAVIKGLVIFNVG